MNAVPIRIAVAIRADNSPAGIRRISEPERRRIERDRRAQTENAEG